MGVLETLVVPVPFCLPSFQRTVHVKNGIAGLDIEAMLKAVSSSTSVSLEKLDFDQFDQLPVPVPVDLGPAQF